ncbi:MAG: hypothetical protein ACLFV3_11370 [Phycisphaeraceae bacterium]
MHLRVGPYVYRVHFVPGHIRHEGENCLGLCDNEKHEIYVSTEGSLAQQIQVVGHEYMEAWLYHFGQNLADKEDYCDLFGLAMTQFVLDLIRQLREDAAAAPPGWADALAGSEAMPPIRVTRHEQDGWRVQVIEPDVEQSGPGA